MCVRRGLQEVQASGEGGEACRQLAKREAKRAASMRAENTPPVAVTAAAPIDAKIDGLPVVRAVPMCTPVPMPNLARAAAALGVDTVAA